jgi:hypothetical protein
MPVRVNAALRHRAGLDAGEPFQLLTALASSPLARPTNIRICRCECVTFSPWTAPWLPPGYEQKSWNAALAASCSAVALTCVEPPSGSWQDGG